MFEFVGIGDTHFDKLDKVLPGMGNKLIANEVKKPLNYALKHGIQHVVFYGDICERARMSYDAHIWFGEAILNPKYEDLIFWIILGNHDFDEHGRHSLELLEFFSRYMKRQLKVITRSCEVGIEKVPVNFMPYPDTETSKKHLNIGHFEVNGAIRDNGKVIKDGAHHSKHLSAIGHLHTPHKVGRAYFSGTLYQTNFGEHLPKSFHHIKCLPDLRHKVVDVPNDPAFKLYNLKVFARSDLSKISKDKLHLYKLFVQDGVRLNPEDLSKYENVIRINRFKDEKDLKAQLEDEWKITEEISTVFQPEEDVKHFLQTKKIKVELQDRVLKLHNRAIKKFLSDQ